MFVDATMPCDSLPRDAMPVQCNAVCLAWAGVCLARAGARFARASARSCMRCVSGQICNLHLRRSQGSDPRLVHVQSRPTPVQCNAAPLHSQVVPVPRCDTAVPRGGRFQLLYSECLEICKMP